MYRQQIRQELRERFRKEYLSLLVHKNVRQSGYQKVKVGDVVIVEAENKKRVDWPIARIVKVYPGKDGVVRSVRIRVAKNGKVSEVDRPIQRLYMLETSSEEIENLKNVEEVVFPVAIEEVDNSTNDDVVVLPVAIEEVDNMTNEDEVVLFGEEKPNENNSETVRQEISQSFEERKVTRSGRRVNQPERFKN